LDDLEDWVAAVIKVTGNVPIEFLANKADLKNQMAMTKAEVQSAAEAHEAPFLFTSAKTGENVETAFAKLAQMMAKRAARHCTRIGTQSTRRLDRTAPHRRRSMAS